MNAFKILVYVIAGLFSLYLIFKSFKWRKLSKTKKVLYAIGLTCTLLIMVLYPLLDSAKTDRETQIAATYDVLVNQTENHITPLTIRIKGTSVGIAGHDNETLVSLGQKFTFVKVGNKLVAKVTVYDTNAQVIAVIDGDYWRLWQQSYDYNNDETAFEIVDPEGIVVFQMELDVKINTAYFSGLAYINDNRYHYWYLSDDPDYRGWANYQYLVKGDKLIDHNVKKIFKYPRFKYLHRRVDDFYQ